MKRLTLALSLLSLGCLSHNGEVYGTIDRTQQTVTVPAGSQGLKGDLKKSLTKMGWQLVVMDAGPTVIGGQVGSPTKLQASETFKTRYRLALSAELTGDSCWGYQSVFQYEISFIDNQTGKEVFAMDGKDCQPRIVRRFGEAVRSALKP